MRVEDGVLMGTIEVPKPEDAKAIGTTIRDVSVCLTPEYKTGQGKILDEVVEHVALTLYPVVEAQGEFLKIAASQDPARKSLVMQEDKDVDIKEKLRTLLSLGADADEEAIITALETMVAEGKVLTTDLKATRAELAKTKTKEPDDIKKEAEKSATELKLEKRVREMRQEAVKVVLDKAVEEGRITPAQRELLEEQARTQLDRESVAEEAEPTLEYIKHFVESSPKEGTLLERKTKSSPSKDGGALELATDRPSEEQIKLAIEEGKRHRQVAAKG